jgi:hypothetical protein
MRKREITLDHYRHVCCRQWSSSPEQPIPRSSSPTMAYYKRRLRQFRKAYRRRGQINITSWLPCHPMRRGRVWSTFSNRVAGKWQRGHQFHTQFFPGDRVPLFLHGLREWRLSLQGGRSRSFHGHRREILKSHGNGDHYPPLRDTLSARHCFPCDSGVSTRGAGPVFFATGTAAA